MNQFSHVEALKIVPEGPLWEKLKMENSLVATKQILGVYYGL